MPLIISQIKSPVDAGEKEIISAALKKISVKNENVTRCGICKTSLDARKRGDIHLVSSVSVSLDPREEKRLAEKYSFCRLASAETFKPIFGKEILRGRIAVIGFGPAGMFAALTLAENGYRPLVLERGGNIDKRISAVERFRSEKIFSETSNIQFGEGGAGTFSDGKLTTRINDPLCGYVLEKFAESGAPANILTEAKPHVGTDNLRVTVKNIREKIISLGGEIRFDTKVSDIDIRNGKIAGITANGEYIPCDAVIAAVGHSARDTFEMLLGKGMVIQPKPFSCGARIEHLQQDVDISLYGEHAGNPALPKGEYQLSHRRGGRCVYTFCMCPGGEVVPAQSEENTAVTNGMSFFARDGKNANSALVVSVSPDDFGNKPLDGVEFARMIERRAFSAAGGTYAAPALTVGAFMNGDISLNGADVVPTYACGVEACSFDGIFPNFITEMMREGISVFSRKMKCFGDRGAVLTAPETRTSSPVRILRNDVLQAACAERFFPCGEGAGYAGGIMSAAVDGIKCASEVMKIFSPYN